MCLRNVTKYTMLQKKHNTSCQIWIINIYYLQNNTQCDVNCTRSIKQKMYFPTIIKNNLRQQFFQKQSLFNIFLHFLQHNVHKYQIITRFFGIVSLKKTQQDLRKPVLTVIGKGFWMLLEWGDCACVIQIPQNHCEKHFFLFSEIP